MSIRRRCATMLPMCAALLAVHAAPALAPAPAHQALVSLAQDMTYSTARLYPMQATTLGIPGHDGELEPASEAYRAAYVARLQQWRAQLGMITSGFDARTSLVDRDDAMLLQSQLAANLNALLVYQFDRKDYSAAANNVVGAVFTQFQHLPIPGQDGATASDLQRAWADITSRLAKAPAYLAASSALVTRPCHLFGVVGAKQLAGAPDFLNAALSEAARKQLGEQSGEYAGFVKARDAALAAIAQEKKYIDAHVSSWPENYAMGRQAYDRMLKEEQLLPFDATAVEGIGHDELAHGWAEQAWLQDVSRRTGVALGAASGGGLAPGGSALIGYYKDRIAELRKFVTSEDVVTIPSWLGSMEKIGRAHV